MSGLAFAQAPSPGLPMRFLSTALAWGIVAGLWLAWQGPSVVLSRWTPATLVLTHLLALGLLGNAMLGSLVQFLPVAAGSPLPCPYSVPWLHAAFNIGLLTLMATLAWQLPALAWPAGGLVAGSLLAFAVLALVAVSRGQGERAVREGIGAAVLALMGTTIIGVFLLAARTGWRPPLPERWVDLHATLGGIGWILGLLAAVGGVTLPMLQGTRVPPLAGVRIWQVSMLITLGLMVAWQAGQLAHVLARAPAWPLAMFALSVWILQACAPHRRNPVLRRFWQAGCACLCAASLGLACPGTSPMLIGALTLGVGLPLLVVGMVLEITAFLTWITLRQRLPRGIRVPGVGSLFDEAHKRRAFALHVLAGSVLVAATLEPRLARPAGVAVALAYASSLGAVLRCWRQGASWQPASPE